MTFRPLHDRIPIRRSEGRPWRRERSTGRMLEGLA